MFELVQKSEFLMFNPGHYLHIFVLQMANKVQFSTKLIKKA